MFARKFFVALIVLTLTTLPQLAHANQSDWAASNFNFRDIKSVIILDATINPNLDYGGMLALRTLQNTFTTRNIQQLNPVCQVFSEEQARVVLSTLTGINLEQLYNEHPYEARQIVMKNAWRMADACVLGLVESFGGKSYTESTDADYVKIVEQRTYYDNSNRPRFDTVLVPLPENYRAEGTDVPAIGMIFRVYSSKNESIILERYEMRTRQPNESQVDLFGDMSASFANLLASKIR